MNPPPDRVVLQLVKRLVAREQLRRHRVRMVELALGCVEDDIFQRQIERAGADRDFVSLIGMGGQPVQELGRARAGAFPSRPASEARSVP